MVREGDTAAHKPLGVTSSTVCIAGIYKEPPEHPCTSENGQFNSSGSCEPKMRHLITIIGKGDKGTVAVLSGEKDHSYCRTSAGGNEQRSRLSVAALPGQQQLETGSRSILGAESAVGTLGGGSLCRLPDDSISNICYWKPDPGAKMTDAFSCKWNGKMMYAFPPFCLITRCLAKLSKDGGEMILVTQTWNTQLWYP